MSLYREARSGRRRLWIGAAIAGVAVAAAGGTVLATSGGDPSTAEQLESLRDDVEPALAALELIPLHYESSSPTTHAAAADQLRVAQQAVGAVVEDLSALDPAATGRLLTDLAALDALVQSTGKSEDVERLAAETAAELRQLVRLD